MLTWRGSRRIGGWHDWNVPDEVHRALPARAAQHAFRCARRQDVDGRPEPVLGRAFGPTRGPAMTE
jgi:hypothetical protein